MAQLPKLLSKTRLMRGYRCLKNIYLNVHSPSLEAPISEETHALFDQGNLVGEAARRCIPGGVLIDNKPWDFVGSLKKTRELIANGTHLIYEAAFEHQGCYARADMIQFSAETKKWTILEVKSSTKVKPEQLDDICLQAWIIANAGLPIERINILHLNSACRYPDLSNLFSVEDVTQHARERYSLTLPKVTEIYGVIRKSDSPPTDIGPHCLAPNECGFLNECWSEKKIPEVSVFDLPKIGDKKWALYNQGIVALDDERLDGLAPPQARMVACYKSGDRFVDADGIRSALKGWKFPLVFLDFETIGPAIPRFDGCGPFRQVPFQFSVHVCASLDGPSQHFEYLHSDDTDPRSSLIPELVKACEGDGSVVSYYSRFEIDRTEEMAAQFPKYANALRAIVARMQDPLPIFREHVYDNGFAGSFSLKNVAPAILGSEHTYDGMRVGDGGAAQRAFEEMISTETPTHEKLTLRRALLEYCKKDTWVMVELVRWLYQETSAHI